MTVATTFTEMQQAELAWWESYLTSARARPRMHALYGARYLPFFWHEFDEGRAVVEIGSGPLPVLDTMRPQRAAIVDTLMATYRDRYLLSCATDAVAMSTTKAVKSDTADTVLLLNVLDHTDDPRTLCREAQRIKAPGGRVLVFVHLGQTDDKHLLVSEADVRGWLAEAGLTVERETIQETVFDPPAYMAVYR